MGAYNATYYYNSVEYPAWIEAKKEKLSIRVEEGMNEVFWYYDHIKKETSSHTFYYPGYPLQSLVVLPPELVAAIDHHIQLSQKKRSGSRPATFIKLFLGFVAFVMLAYLLLVPWIAGRLAQSFPISTEKEMGESAFASLKNDFEIDPSKTAYLNDFFRELHLPSTYDVQITVVKSNEANAFALPGGHIVVYDKILAGMGSYEELAALLAHEFTHVEKRHTLRSLFRQMAGNIFILLLMGDAGDVGTVVLSNASRLKNLSYSRSLEKEADEWGAALLAQRHIDCAGFVRLFRMLQRQNRAQTSEWLSSHPELTKRIKHIQENTACRSSRPDQNERLHTLFLQLKTAE